MDTKRSYESLSGGIFMIGIGILFLVPGVGFWPWILAVIGAAGLPWLGWQGFFWMTGLAVLFWSGYFWSGILILIGLNMFVGALTRESEGSPFASASTEADEEPFAVEEPPTHV